MIFRSIILTVRNISKAVEKIKTHILCSVTFPENRAVYEIMWKSIEQPERPQMAI
jgi:hypothetical protein